MSAFEAAIGTVCEAVDFVILNAALRKDASELPYVPSDIPGAESYSSRVFVAVRPPGHHCGEVWLYTIFFELPLTFELFPVHSGGVRVFQ